MSLTVLSKRAKLVNSRVQRRLQQIKRLGAKKKRQVLQFVDIVRERERLKRQVHLSVAPRRHRAPTLSPGH